MFQSPALLSSLEIDQTELYMSIGIARINGRVMKKSFEVLPLSERVAKSACPAKQGTAENDHDPKQKKRREQMRRDIAQNIHAPAKCEPRKTNCENYDA